MADTLLLIYLALQSLDCFHGYNGILLFKAERQGDSELAYNGEWEKPHGFIQNNNLQKKASSQAASSEWMLAFNGAEWAAAPACEAL